MSMIFAFGHQKSVGKDTFIKFCIDILRPQIHKLRIVRRGFADRLYDMCHSLYSWAGFKSRTHYVNNPNCKNDLLFPINKTVRQLLIELGQHLRAFDNDIWINSNLRTEDFDILFISDLRFPNEFLHCKSLNSVNVKIERPGLPEPTDEADIALNDWGNKWDLILSNDNFNSLYSQAERFVETYILPQL